MNQSLRIWAWLKKLADLSDMYSKIVYLLSSISAALLIIYISGENLVSLIHRKLRLLSKGYTASLQAVTHSITYPTTASCWLEDWDTTKELF